MAYKKFDHYKEALMAGIVELAEKDERVVFLDADLSSCIGSGDFACEYPERFFNCGIAEANMMSVAGGLSSTGLIPFAHTFGCFASRRAYDQVFLSIGYTKQVVHIIGSDPGIVAQYNGGTHMPFEDIALFRQVPNFIVYEPSDSYSTYSLVKQAFESGKPSYIRVPRKGIDHRYTENDNIVLGKGMELASGEDVAIIALGAVMVNCAMEAKDILEAKGIKATVVDLLTIKPMDIDLIEKVAKRCGNLLVCENGRYTGGIGEAIASHMATVNPVKMGFVNVGERYGEVGNLSYLKEAFGFTGAKVAEAAEKLVK